LNLRRLPDLTACVDAGCSLVIEAPAPGAAGLTYRVPGEKAEGYDGARAGDGQPERPYSASAKPLDETELVSRLPRQSGHLPVALRVPDGIRGDLQAKPNRIPTCCRLSVTTIVPESGAFPGPIAPTAGSYRAPSNEELVKGIGGGPCHAVIMTLPWEHALAATESVALVQAASLEIRASAAETMRPRRLWVMETGDHP
jgi:hypothetical protein